MARWSFGDGQVPGKDLIAIAGFFEKEIETRPTGSNPAFGTIESLKGNPE